MVRDNQPDGPAPEFLDLEVLKAIDTSAPAPAAATDATASAAAAAAGAGAAAGGAGAGAQDDSPDLTGPIADPPAPFEWTDWD